MLRPLAPLQLVGSVHVVPVGSAPLDIPVRREISPGNCLAVGPETIDFGTLNQGCNSVNRNAQVYNACSSPLTIAAISLTEAGEPPGTPGGPGSTTCPEFFIVSGLSAYGSRPDICDPNWWSRFVSLGLSCSGYRTTFHLTSRPAGALVLALDGQPVPNADWAYDVANNAVSFIPSKVPAPGQTLTELLGVLHSLKGRGLIADSFECAAEALAPRCGHWNCRILGHGMEKSGKMYCCAHCAIESGVTELRDRA